MILLKKLDVCTVSSTLANPTACVAVQTKREEMNAVEQQIDQLQQQLKNE